MLHYQRVKSMMHICRVQQLLSLVLILMCLPAAHASGRALVVAIDTSLPAESLKTAHFTVNELLQHPEAQGDVGLVLFDQVVEYVLPRTDNTQNTRLQIKSAIGSLYEPGNDSAVLNAGNPAVGIERALAEFEGGVTGSVFLITAASTPPGQQSQWLRLVLLPDAQDKGVLLTLLTPAQAGNIALVSDVSGFAGNAHAVLSRNAENLGELTRRLSKVADVPAPQIAPVDTVITPLQHPQVSQSIEPDTNTIVDELPSNIVTLDKPDVNIEKQPLSTSAGSTGITEGGWHAVYIGGGIFTLLLATVFLIYKLGKRRSVITPDLAPLPVYPVDDSADYLPLETGPVRNFSTRASSTHYSGNAITRRVHDEDPPDDDKTVLRPK